eukprot:9975141-Alexandrium_andersonii.AAC.1
MLAPEPGPEPPLVPPEVASGLPEPRPEPPAAREAPGAEAPAAAALPLRPGGGGPLIVLDGDIPDDGLPR